MVHIANETISSISETATFTSYAMAGGSVLNFTVNVTHEQPIVQVFLAAPPHVQISGARYDFSSIFAAASTTGTAIGAAVAGFSALLLAIVLVVVNRRRKRRQEAARNSANRVFKSALASPFSEETKFNAMFHQPVALSEEQPQYVAPITIPVVREENGYVSYGQLAQSAVGSDGETEAAIATLLSHGWGDFDEPEPQFNTHLNSTGAVMDQTGNAWSQGQYTVSATSVPQLIYSDANAEEARKKDQNNVYDVSSVAVQAWEQSQYTVVSKGSDASQLIYIDASKTSNSAVEHRDIAKQMSLGQFEQTLRYESMPSNFPADGQLAYTDGGFSFDEPEQEPTIDILVGNLYMDTFEIAVPQFIDQPAYEDPSALPIMQTGLQSRAQQLSSGLDDPHFYEVPLARPRISIELGDASDKQQEESTTDNDYYVPSNTHIDVKDDPVAPHVEETYFSIDVDGLPVSSVQATYAVLDGNDTYLTVKLSDYEYANARVSASSSDGRDYDLFVDTKTVGVEIGEDTYLTVKPASVSNAAQSKLHSASDIDRDYDISVDPELTGFGEVEDMYLTLASAGATRHHAVVADLDI